MRAASYVFDLAQFALLQEAPYYAGAIAALSTLLKDVGLGDPQTQYLHLRALYHTWSGNVLAALNDFDSIWKADPTSFPMELVRDILAVNYQARQVLSTDPVFAQTRIWRELLGNSSIPPMTPDRRQMALPEIGSVSNVLAAISGQDVDLAKFTAVVKLLGITDTSKAARNLYTGLCQLSALDRAEAPNAVATADTGMLNLTTFKQFIETWRGVARDRRGHSYEQLLGLQTDEKVLKVMPLVRKPPTGAGTLILTHTRLFIVPNSKGEAIEITRLEKIVSVEKIQYKVIIPPGVPALRILTKQVDSQASSRRRRSLGARMRAAVTGGASDDITEHILLFFSEREAWYGYLTEMTMGHKVSQATKDFNIISQAAHNIELAETVSRVAISAVITPNKRRHLSQVFAPQVRSGKVHFVVVIPREASFANKGALFLFGLAFGFHFSTQLVSIACICVCAFFSV